MRTFFYTSLAFLLTLIALAPRVEAQQFLTLPFADPLVAVQPQQGFVYNYESQSITPCPPPEGYRCHRGIDYIKGTIDQPPWSSFSVLAAADGRAVAVSACSLQDSDSECSKTYGTFVYIAHAETDPSGLRFFTLYAHLGKASSGIVRKTKAALLSDLAARQGLGDISTWTPVSRGMKVGDAGDSGAANGVIHLHFEVQRGGYINHKTDPYGIYDIRSYYPSPCVKGPFFGTSPTPFVGSLWTTCPPVMPPSSSTWLSFVEGNPGPPGDGTFVTTTSGRYHIQTPINGGQFSTGLTLSFFGTESELAAVQAVQANFYKPSDPTRCGVGVSSLAAGATRFGMTPGIFFNYTASQLANAVQILNSAGCAVTLNDIELREIDVVRFDRSSVSTFDAVAALAGEGTIPQSPQLQLLVSAPPYDTGQFSSGSADLCDVGTNSAGNQDPASGRTQMSLAYDFVPPCSHPLSGAQILYNKGTAVRLASGTVVTATVRYRVNAVSAQISSGRARNTFILLLDLTNQAISPLPAVFFGNGSQAHLVDQCDASAGFTCKPTGPLATGDHEESFAGTVSCGASPSPCALPDMRTGVQVFAEALDPVRTTGVGSLEIDVLALEFRGQSLEGLR